MKKKTRVAAAAAALCLLAAGGAFLLLRSGGEDIRYERVWEGDAGRIQKDGERKNTLVVASSSDSSAASLWKEETAMASSAGKLVYPGLVELDENRLGKEKLADRIQFDETGKTAEVSIRGDAAFSDGTHLNADLLIQAYERYASMQKAEGRQLGYLGALEGAAEFVNGEAEHISGLEQTGNNSVQFRFLQADSRNLEVLAVPLTREEEGRVLGCGEYRIDTENPRKELTLVRTENTPFQTMDYQNVQYRYYTGGQLEEILAGFEADLVLVGKEEMETVKESGWMSLYRIPSSAYAGLAVSSGSELLQSRENRQALMRALDRTVLKNTVYGEDNGSVPAGVFRRTAGEDGAFPFQGKEAGEKLTAGPEGVRRVRLKTGQDAFSLGVAADLTRLLGESGIQVEEVTESTVTDDPASYDVSFEAQEDGRQAGFLQALLAADAELSGRFQERMSQALQNAPMEVYAEAESFWEEEACLLPVHCTDTYAAVAADCDTEAVLRLLR